MACYVYILASRRNGTLYVGVTRDVARRMAEHRAGAPGSFTARYGIERLVHVEAHETPGDAIRREKSLKRWRRRRKLALIEAGNPRWEDLYERLNW